MVESGNRKTTGATESSSAGNRVNQMSADSGSTIYVGPVGCEAPQRCRAAAGPLPGRGTDGYVDEMRGTRRLLAPLQGPHQAAARADQRDRLALTNAAHVGSK